MSLVVARISLKRESMDRSRLFGLRSTLIHPTAIRLRGVPKYHLNTYLVRRRHPYTDSWTVPSGLLSYQ